MIAQSACSLARREDGAYRVYATDEQRRAKRPVDMKTSEDQSRFRNQSLGVVYDESKQDSYSTDSLKLVELDPWVFQASLRCRYGHILAVVTGFLHEPNN